MKVLIQAAERYIQSVTDLHDTAQYSSFTHFETPKDTESIPIWDEFKRAEIYLSIAIQHAKDLMRDGL